MPMLLFVFIVFVTTNVELLFDCRTYSTFDCRILHSIVEPIPEPILHSNVESVVFIVLDYYECRTYSTIVEHRQ